MKILSNNEVIIEDVKYLKGLASEVGLMFSKKLKPNQAVILERHKESIINSSIHMLFVFQKLKIIWLNEDKEIVDSKLAYPFISFLSPKKPAKYVIELNPKTKTLNIGEKLKF